MMNVDSLVKYYTTQANWDIPIGMDIFEKHKAKADVKLENSKSCYIQLCK